MSLERFTATSANQLTDDLTKFIYAHDRSFATGKTDVSRHVAIRETRVQAGDDSDETLELSDQERIELAGYRNIYLPGKGAPRPSDFVITHRSINQLDSIPGQLRHVLDSGLIEQYDITEPGDLNEVREIEYAVTIDPDGEPFVGRDIRYRLRDVKDVIYRVRESKLPKTEKVYVTTENDHLRVRTAVLPEPIDDIGLQVQVGIDFCEYTLDEIADMEQNWLDVELADQIACINAIMNSFTTGRPVKNIA